MVSQDDTLRCEVLIVGGGPAGAAAAGHLTRNNVDCVVLDKAHFPRHKVCAGWITPQVVELMDLDIHEYARHHTLQPISAFRTGLIGGDTLLTDYGETVSYGIRRCEFDHYLLKQSGARCVLGESLSELAEFADGWRVNGRLDCEMLIGAAGHYCPIGRHLSGSKSGGNKLSPDAPKVVVAQEVEFEMTADQCRQTRIEPEVPELYFCPDFRGYGWCFRKQNFLNIGLGREGEKRLSEAVGWFLDFLAASGRLGFDISERFQGHAYRLYPVSGPVVADRMLRIGDSAGLAYRHSGEGIRPAIESGLMAASLIASAAGDYSEGRLSAYEQRLEEHFGPLQSAATTARWCPRSLRSAIGRALMRSHRFTRQVLLDRWFLHRHQPAWNAASPAAVTAATH